MLFNTISIDFPSDNKTNEKTESIVKPSVFIVLLFIRNQSKAKTIPLTIFETVINNNSHSKLRRFHGGFSILSFFY